MALSWSGRRQLLYTAVAGIAALVVLVFLYESFLTSAPSCFNNKQDGTEAGVDCGGTCALLCPNQTVPAQVLWSRSFQTGLHTYTAAAYIENRNPGAGAKGVPYTFDLYDDQNELVLERTGTVDLPPTQNIPIVVPNINVGNRTVTKTLFSFAVQPVWERTTTPQLPLSSQLLSTDGSTLEVTISNPTPQDARHVTVAAVLYDTQGTARGASITVLERLLKKSDEPLVFTWPGGVQNIVRAEVVVLPSF
ncbi:MAG: hypothetical protein KGI70_00950 [Patescibacteria group bacterium]|nr:hypothetical protein [Patescibacteria group bacterium]